jgi:hypothetical protein
MTFNEKKLSATGMFLKPSILSAWSVVQFQHNTCPGFFNAVFIKIVLAFGFYFLVDNWRKIDMQYECLYEYFLTVSAKKVTKYYIRDIHCLYSYCMAQFCLLNYLCFYSQQICKYFIYLSNNNTFQKISFCTIFW